MSAITVSAASTDTVVLRGLTLVGVGGQKGIVISGFTNYGINVGYSSVAGMTAELSCEECVSSYNFYGFRVNLVPGAMATTRVSHSVATNNTSHGFVQVLTGVFKSLGNNLVDGNGTEERESKIAMGLRR